MLLSIELVHLSNLQNALCHLAKSIYICVGFRNLPDCALYSMLAPPMVVLCTSQSVNTAAKLLHEQFYYKLKTTVNHCVVIFAIVY